MIAENALKAQIPNPEILTDFTFPLADTLRTKGTELTSSITERNRTGNTRIISHFSRISPHGLTHIHLPWTFNWEFLKYQLQKLKELERKRAKKPLDSRDEDVYKDLATKFKDFDEKLRYPPAFDSVQGKQECRFYDRIRIEDTVIINCQDKIPVMTKFVNSSKGKVMFAAHDSECMFPSSMNGEALLELISSLHIRQEEIVDRLEEPAGEIGGNMRNKYESVGRFLKNKVVLFSTGWNDVFRPKYKDIGHELIQMMHPYFYSPYLDLNTLSFLISSGAIGIGTDTYGMDSCIYYVDPEVCIPAMKRVLFHKALKNNHLSDDIHLPVYPPCLLYLLSSRILMIENLNIPRDICSERIQVPLPGLPDLSGTKIVEKKFVRGKSIILPISVSYPGAEDFPEDAILVKYLFVKDQDL